MPDSEDLPPLRPRPTVLCADDNSFVRDALFFTLKRAGYQPECVVDGKEALQRILETETPYAALITDNEMPHMSGIELVTELQRRGRSLKTIVIAGNLKPGRAAEFRALGIHTILDKPCLPSSVVEAVKGLNLQVSDHA